MAFRVDHCRRIVEALLLPPLCVLCGGRGQAPDFDLCQDCEAELPRIERPCTRCALPLGGAPPPGQLCGMCLRRPPPYDHVFAAGRYAYPLNHLVRRLKYEGRLSCGRVLGTLLARQLLAIRGPPWPDVLLPVPLADARFVSRGSNQAIEIGRSLERLIGTPLSCDLLERVRPTRDQVGLAARDRRRNVRRAFRLRRAEVPAHVAIIDDVVTTGSTVAEIARLLKRAGVETVEVWAAARATSRGPS